MENKEESKEMTFGTGKSCRFGHCSMKGRRPTMEDDHNAILDINFEKSNKTGSFFGVYDGHGGDDVAKYLAKNLPSEIVYLTDVDKDAEITQCFVNVDSRLDATYIGSTCIIVCLVEDEIICANSGDSRCIYFEKQKNNPVGKLYCLSNDQIPIIEEERKRILESGSVVIQGRVDGNLAVSRAFGDKYYKKSTDSNKKLLSPDKQPVTVCPEVKKRKITENLDFGLLILACDGVWDVWNNEDLCQEINMQINELGKDEEALGKIAESVVTKTIKKRHSQDNCTLIIVHFN